MTLGELGLDSLMGVDVRQTLQWQYEIVLSMQEIRKLSMNKLKELAQTTNTTPTTPVSTHISYDTQNDGPKLSTSRNDEPPRVASLADHSTPNSVHPQSLPLLSNPAVHSTLRMGGTHYDPQSLVPQETVIMLNDGIYNPKTNTPLFIIGPIDGSVRALKNVVRHLECRVYGLQGTPDVPLDSIEDMASYYIKVCMWPFFS